MKDAGTITTHDKASIAFVSACSGIMMRNFVVIPDGVVDELKKRFTKIVLIVPEEARLQTEQDFASDSVCVEGVHIYSPNQSKLLSIFEFIARHLSFTDGARMFAWYGVRLDTPVAGGNRLLYPFRVLVAETLGKISSMKQTIFPYLEKKLFTARPYKKIFDAYHPCVVFSTNVQHFLDRELIREAQRHHVPTVGMPGSWDHFPKQYTPTHTDRLVVWNTPQYDEAITLQGYLPAAVTIVGAPYFDMFARRDILMSREAFCTQLGLDPDVKIVLFVSAAVYAPDDADIVSGIVAAMKKNIFSEPIQVLIRPYPGFVEEERKRFGQFENQPGVVIDWQPANTTFTDRWRPTENDLREHINVLFHADIVVNTYSSVALEASIFAKPVIMIGYDGYQKRPYSESLERFKRLGHYQNVFETGGVVLVESEQELLNSLKNFLENPSKNADKIRALKEKMVGPIEGTAASRIAQEVATYASTSI